MKYEYWCWDTNIFEGYYETSLMHEGLFYSCALAQENPDAEIEIDILKYDKLIGEKVAELLGAMCKDKGIIKGVAYHDTFNPSSYNYHSDILSLDLEIDWNAMMSWVTQDGNRTGFDRYLGKKYTPRSGYIPFPKNNAKDYFDQGKYENVMVDYYLLTLIADGDDVVEHFYEKQKDDEYHYDLYEYVDQAFDECAYIEQQAEAV